VRKARRDPRAIAFFFKCFPAGGLREYLQSRIPDVITPSTLNTARESAVAGYRGLRWPFKIRRMAAIVFQFRVVAGAP
jgi:hypothetical protein